jgi:hypothetical protein
MAYICTPLSKELLPGTSNYRVITEFTGDAGEPTFRKELIITPAMTVQQCREWAFLQIRDAAPKKSVADLISVGVPVSPLAPAASPAATAEQVWREKAQRLKGWDAMSKVAVLPAAVLTKIGELKSDVEATAQAGYVASNI